MDSDEKSFVPDLPVARTRNGIARNDQPWIIAPFDPNAPEIVTPSLRVVVQNEAFVTFTDTQPHRLRDVAPQLMSRGYVEQFWIYGIKAMTGNPAKPVANTQNAIWGWTPSSLVNLLIPWNGGYSGLISPPPGQVFDIGLIWFAAGAANDGLYLLAY